ncbi:MAG TPA: AI-2E family transporter [Candidatus Limnocylindria bacterium]|nr:AI-2E family transporter [Candidatus Limnocylindria bacterium]
MTRQIRRAMTGLRDRFMVEGSSADIGADMSLALPPDELEVPPEPMGPVAVTLRVVGVVVAVALVLGLLWLLRGLVLNVFLALLFAAGLLGAARGFEQRMSRAAAALTVNAIAIGVVIVVILLAARPAMDAIGSFVQAIPGIVDSFSAWIEGLLGSDAYDQLFTDEVDVSFLLGGILDVTLATIAVIANLVVIVIIEIFLLIERRPLLDGVLEFMDSEDRPATRYILTTGIDSLGKYLRGLIVSMAFIGVATAVGMWLIGIPYAIPMGIIAFFTAAIPYIGGLFALVPILIIAGVEVGPTAVLLMIGWQIIIQQIEGSVVTPTVQGKAINISPLVVMLGVTAGITLGGLVGGIIAIPIAALIGVGIRGVVIPMRRRAEAREQARRAAYLAARQAAIEAAAADPA